MDFELLKAASEYKNVIKNLMQFYQYDFSEYLKTDVGEDGCFTAYPPLEDYWKDKDHRFPYIIIKDKKYIGFVLVRFIESAKQNYFSIAEFFIMKKYRREGIGKAAAEKIFNLYKGHWQIHQRESNHPAHAFWIKVIDEYTKGRFTKSYENGRIIQNFES